MIARKTEDNFYQPKWKILMIDDDLEDYIITRDMLKAAKGQKVEMHWASTFEAGLAELKKGSYDVVLVDYDLGLHSGLELIRQASQHNLALPLLLFTGRGGYEVDIEALQAGATLYLTKDEANPLLLERLIRYAIESKQKETALRKHEANLRENEKRLAAEKEWFRTTLSSIGDAVITCDPQGLVTFLNPVAEALTGWNSRQAEGKPLEQIFKIINETTGQPVENPVEKVLHNGAVVGLGNHTALISRSGQIIAIEDSAAPIKDAVGQMVGVVMVFHDVTERRKAAEQLRYQAGLLAQVQDAIIAVDRQGLVTYWNKAAEQIFGISEAEIIGQPRPSLLQSQVVDSSAEQVQLLLEQEGHWEGEVLYRRKNGTSFTALVRTVIINDQPAGRSGYVSSVRDITERKQADETLRRLEARWNAAIESFEVGAIIATEDEQVVYWNPAAQRMHGFLRPSEGIEPLEATAVTFQLWTMDGNHRLALHEWPMRRIKRGEPVRNLELRLRRPDQGWEKIISYSGVMVDTAGGERLIFLTCQDLTEQRHAEEAVQASEARLRMALDAARMVAWEYDPVTQQVRMSENAERVLELPHRHETSDQGYSLIHPDDVERHRQLVSQAIASGGSYASVYRHDHHEQVLWLEEHGQAVLDRSGKVIRLVGVVQNITERKQAEERLQQALHEAEQSRQTLNAIMEYIPEGLTIADGKEVTIRMVSRYGQALLGGAHTSQTAKEVADTWKVYDRDGQTLLPTEQLPLVRAIHRGEVVVNQDLVQINAAGKHLNLSCNAGPILDATGAITGGIVAWRDISERMQVEEALRQSESKFSTLFHQAAIPAMLCRLPDQVVVDANDAWGRLFGYAREEILGKQAAHIGIHSDLTTRQKIIDEVQRHPVKDLEFSVHTHHGRILMVSANINAIELDGQKYALISVQDITERKRVEQALVESERRLRRLMEGNIIGINVRDAVGRIQDSNAAFLQMIGYTCEEFAAGAVLMEDIVPAHYREIDRQAIEETIRSGSCKPYEKEYRHKDGHLIPALVAYTRLDDNGERLIGYVLDLTERRQAQLALQDYAEKLQRSNRELEQFALVASHDLQEPLRKIRLFGGKIQEMLQGQLNEEAQDHFTRMMAAAGRMQVMIQDLLELSRVNTQVRPFGPVNLSAAAAEVVSDLEPRMLRAGGKVEIESLPTIEADPIQIHQMLQNLIGNGLKFHKRGVPPQVTVSGALRQSPQGNGQVVTIQVADNGVGFDPRNLETIFQPFQRLHGRSEYEGTGMGLAIVKKIVERHHGEITASSTPGEGATFFVTLPVKQTKHQ